MDFRSLIIVVEALFSLKFFCMEFAECLESVNLCISLNLGDFLPFLMKKFFLFRTLSLLPIGLQLCYVRSVEVIYLTLWGFFQFFISLLCWIIFIVLFSSLLTLSFIIYILILSPSSDFFSLQILYFSVQ